MMILSHCFLHLAIHSLVHFIHLESKFRNLYELDTFKAPRI